MCVLVVYSPELPWNYLIFYLIYDFLWILNSLTKNKLENNWDDNILFSEMMTFPFDLV